MMEKESPYLYICDGTAPCAGQRGCIFWDPDHYDCEHTRRIEYAKNKDKFKSQLLDDTFPKETEWDQIDGVFVEKP